MRFPVLAIIVWKTQLWCLTSQALEVTIWRDGMEYEQKYARGNPVTTLLSQILPPELKDHQGTRIRFWPDKEGLLWPSKPHIHFMVFGLWIIPLYTLIVMVISVYDLFDSGHAVFTTTIQFDYNTIAGRIRELAFLNPKVES